MIAQTFADPWRYQAHPEVWVLVAFLVGAYVYMARVIGPSAVPAGTPAVTRRQVAYFTGAMALLWFGADWPVHDIGEQYLYSVHMFQHMIFSYFVPPLALLATPAWMARALVGTGTTRRAFGFFTSPIIAGVLFNVMVMILHIPGLVNASTENGVLHYSLHLLVVTTALLMWCPVLNPLEELRIGPGAKCIYLFLMSVVPTVPAGWLTFAEGAVYKHYNQPVRVWGLSVTDDQQIAGAIMKIGGGFFLWTIVIYLFFKRFGSGFETENTYVRAGQMPRDEIIGHDEPTLTYSQVTAAFERTAPASDAAAPTSLEAEQTPSE
jgi:putative membrane protein